MNQHQALNHVAKNLKASFSSYVAELVNEGFKDEREAEKFAVGVLDAAETCREKGFTGAIGVSVEKVRKAKAIAMLIEEAGLTPAIWEDGDAMAMYRYIAQQHLNIYLMSLNLSYLTIERNEVRHEAGKFFANIVKNELSKLVEACGLNPRVYFKEWYEKTIPHLEEGYKELLEMKAA